jgi:hypothetical protein
VDAGKVKVVLNELREELHARRGTGVASSAADDAPVQPAHHNDAADLGSGHPGQHGSRGKNAPHVETGVLVELSSEARAMPSPPEPVVENANAPEFSQPRIPELTLPFAVPQEPFIVIKPQFVSAVLAAALAALLLMVLFL